MKVLGVIPARYGSSRLEGKPLKKIHGKSMIEWVYKRTIKSDLDDVVVATDDKRIYEEVINFGGKVIMTKENHQSGTDRIMEVIESDKYINYDFIINVQGDEPLIDPESINMLIDSYKNDNAVISTLKKEIVKDEDIDNPNNVKVISDFNNNAIYFSRSRIPYNRNKLENFKYYKHIGIYGYTRDFLLKLKDLPKGKLEDIESLEQLRFLENGYNIKIYETKSKIFGVDTEEDLVSVIKYIEENNIKL